MDAFILLPTQWFITLVFCYGLIIGSFLNVVIYRFHTGKSIAGNSHCLSCGERLKAHDLIPLFSYLWLRGRCRCCGSHIPSRYFLVELLTGVLFVFAALAADSVAELSYFLILVALFVVIIVYDIRHLIIPDMLTLSVTIVAMGWLLYNWFVGQNLNSLLLTIGAAAGASMFFYFLWWISGGRWVGFGDVKLAFPLGLIVGAPLVFTMIVYSFWIGAVISVFLVLLAKLQRGKLRFRTALPNLTIKSVVPFAPFLIAGCLLTLFTSLNVLTLFTFAAI